MMAKRLISPLLTQASVILADGSARFLELGALAFVREQPLLGGPGRSAAAAALEFSFVAGPQGLMSRPGFQLFRQEHSRQFAVFPLGAFPAASNFDAGRFVHEEDCGLDFVDVLSARPGGAQEFFLDVLFPDFQLLEARSGGGPVLARESHRGA